MAKALDEYFATATGYITLQAEMASSVNAAIEPSVSLPLFDSRLASRRELGRVGLVLDGRRAADVVPVE